MISCNPALDDGYWDPKQINSDQLIQEVKPHEILYNPNHEHYTNKNVRDEVWDVVCTSMFPLYPHYKSSIKLQIGYQVRHKWKTLRNSAARIAKLMTVSNNYTRKSKEIYAMEFVIPYIKTSYCEKVSEKLGLARPQPEDTTANDPDNDTINEIDLQQLIKEEKFEYINDDELDDEEIMNIKLSPLPEDHYEEPASTAPNNLFNSIVFRCTDSPVPTSSNPSASKPSILLTHRSSIPLMQKPTIRKHQEPLAGKSDESLRKRPRQDNTPNNTGDTSKAELQRKLMDLLVNNEQRKLQRVSQGEDDPSDLDRMFLLSLVPDFKQLPNNKKMTVKAKIASVIAEAIE